MKGWMQKITDLCENRFHDPATIYAIRKRRSDNERSYGTKLISIFLRALASELSHLSDLETRGALSGRSNESGKSPEADPEADARARASPVHRIASPAAIQIGAVRRRASWLCYALFTAYTRHESLRRGPSVVPGLPGEITDSVRGSRRRKTRE